MRNFGGRSQEWYLVFNHMYLLVFIDINFLSYTHNYTHLLDYKLSIDGAPVANLI
ncbi:hypothetical protein PDTA9759_00820 [Phytobacter diazotrophicus]|uniref:Uncharacterized protein n=1 Tax=Phytobacter diazotrophicus TaxID=395631 RepID=A0ABM7VNN9_9ENTR|nr:hypothetical protein EDC53_11272 [Phytobacter diazotrophicus]BDD48594.1 hypothetical protein PDTA9734_00810 [Phytobacter diazotrophicus]BEG79626.1 hypothetical protein PDTA9730_00820 [Phytobacter diazotrophicus]BEG85426.1 hypothetical protein PDTA9759_00820 [Phytobacter diazotrophicus]BEG91223.1 hypothetical protein PDTA9832_00820 [Phytobacter diazotrophicus]